LGTELADAQEISSPSSEAKVYYCTEELNSGGSPEPDNQTHTTNILFRL
jgi:hypothetical protein